MPPAETPRILLVDDEPSITDVVKMVLGQIGGYQIESELDPRLALQRIESFHPDLLILDTYMPHMSGMEIAQRARLHPDFGDRPILFFSGREPTDVSALTFGRVEFLMKGSPTQNLLDLVDQMLAERAHS